MMDGFFSDSDMLTKVALFALVQALVYLILSKSSTVFSADGMTRSLSFRPMRSVSVRRLQALLSDMPPGGEVSPSAPRPRREDSLLSSDYPKNWWNLLISLLQIWGDVVFFVDLSLDWSRRKKKTNFRILNFIFKCVSIHLIQDCTWYFLGEFYYLLINNKIWLFSFVNEIFF